MTTSCPRCGFILSGSIPLKCPKCKFMLNNYHIVDDGNSGEKLVLNIMDC